MKLKSKRPLLFFRLDDVGFDLFRFNSTIEVFAKYELPVCLQVIPTTITGDWIKTIGRARTSLGSKMLICQHGYSHKNYGSKFIEYEFGVGRSLDEQYDDMAAGLALMKSLFGNDFYPAFCPPYNAFDLNTLYVAEELGYDVFSQDGKQYLYKTRMYDFSADIDLIENYEAIRFVDQRCLLIELERRLFPGGITGVQVHHNYLTQEGFELLAELLKWVKACESLQTVTFREMLQIARDEM